MLHGDWNYPTTIKFGPGSVGGIASVCASVGAKRPILVTDTGTATLPFMSRILSSLREGGIRAVVFSDVSSNPTERNVMDGVDACRAGSCDSVIAIGGGSGIDAGKAISLMVGQERPLADFEDVGDNWKRVITDRLAPCIAVPTTAGTGSEVGRAAVIVDTSLREKKIIFHPQMMPARVICDPELTLDLPPWLTAATGLDAFTHCFEAYCAPAYHPFADGIALKGMQMVAQWLPVAFRDGSNIEARSHMMAAASMGAAAFQKGLGAVHAVSHAVGAHYDTHHGLTNAVFLPYVLVRNQIALGTKLQEVANAIGLRERDFESVLSWLLDFRHTLGVPNDAGALGVLEKDVDTLAKKSKKDAALNGNPVELSTSDLGKIIQNAISGILPEIAQT